MSMIPNRQPLPSQALLVVSHGSYSDYSVDACYIVEQELNLGQALDDWLSQNGAEALSYSQGTKVRELFLKDLETRGILRRLPYFEANMPDYFNDTLHLEKLD